MRGAHQLAQGESPVIRQGRKEEAERSAFGTTGVKWTGQQRKDKPEHRRLFLWHAAAEKIRKREKGIRRWTMGWTSRKVSASLCYSLQGGRKATGQYFDC